jgi:hypothetical protein
MKKRSLGVLFPLLDIAVLDILLIFYYPDTIR